MNFSEGRGSHINSNTEKRMNLGGPSYRTCLKQQAGYTNEPGVWKPLSLAQLFLMQQFHSSPIISTNHLIAYPCCLANDGTALKPAIEFDERLKENVGLTFNLDSSYVKSNPTPSTEFLKEKLIAEAVVTSVTSLDNKSSLPCAVEYSTKSGKTAEACKSMFTEQIKTLQTCEACQKKAETSKNILSQCYNLCMTFCQTCFDMKGVCTDCKGKSHTSHHPALRACSSCMDQGKVCVRRAIFVATADCESGNKGAFETIRNSIEEGNIDPQLSILTVLPDCPHVGKTLKGSFSNWWLKLDSERGNIALLRTLRNRSSPTTMAAMRKLVPRNDHVKNKDRQDPSAVLTLCNESLLTYLLNVGYVCHTIIPELDKFTDINRLGMYPSPISVSLGSYGWLLFLSWNSKEGSSTLYRARLHSPVDKISVIRKNLPSTRVHSAENVVFLSSSGGPVIVDELEDNCVYLKPAKITSVRIWSSLKERFGLQITGTLAVVRRLTKQHLQQKEQAEQEYNQKGHEKGQINFPDKEMQRQVQAIGVVDRELVYFAEGSSSSIVSAQLKYDGYGICATNVQHVAPYEEDWGTITSLCISNNKLFVSHDEDINVIDLANHEGHSVYKARKAGCVLASFQRGVIFCEQTHSSLFRIDEHENVSLFAGSQVEGCQDGPARECKFKQLTDVCVEFDSVLYVCDAQSSSVKILTPLMETARYLRAIGKLYNAFSVHKKGEKPSIGRVSDAASKVRECKRVLSDFEQSVRAADHRLSERALNGPQGMASAATVKSVDMLDWGLHRLESLMASLSFEDTNLLSCMTLDVEHLHATSHVKHPLVSKKEYCKELGNTIKESIKRLSSSTFYYFTSEKGSWYPNPEHDIPLQSLPQIPQLPVVQLPDKAVQEMRDYAQTYGAAVRQRTNRQETTMSRHGTMPEMIYQRQLQMTGKVTFTCAVELPEQDPKNREDSTNDDDDDAEDIEYDRSTDEESGDEEDRTAAIAGLDDRSTFLVGAVSRYGRAVRVNSRYIL